MNVKLVNDVLGLNDEVWGADEITCPYCGVATGDSWECADENDEEYCEECGKYFSYERHVSVTYNSRKIEQPKEG